MKEIPIVQADMKLQEEFSDFVQATDILKTDVQKSLDEIKMLFDSIMHQYF